MSRTKPPSGAARAIADGLSEPMRRDVLRAEEYPEGVALRTGNALRKRGIVRPYAGRLGLWTLTEPLGREVAALLSAPAPMEVTDGE